MNDRHDPKEALTWENNYRSGVAATNWLPEDFFDETKFFNLIENINRTALDGTFLLNAHRTIDIDQLIFPTNKQPTIEPVGVYGESVLLPIPGLAMEWFLDPQWTLFDLIWGGFLMNWERATSDGTDETKAAWRTKTQQPGKRYTVVGWEQDGTEILGYSQWIWQCPWDPLNQISWDVLQLYKRNKKIAAQRMVYYARCIISSNVEAHRLSLPNADDFPAVLGIEDMDNFPGAKAIERFDNYGVKPVYWNADRDKMTSRFRKKFDMFKVSM